MANPTTDTMYNAASREIQMKYEIYFVERQDPLVVTRDDYLASSSGLEEVQSDSESLMGKVSSNEITISLYNESRIFTPTNADSPYYGRIRKGVRIVAYGRAVEGENLTDWDALGTYYVTEWTTSSSGMLASVTANDKLYSVFDAPTPIYPVTKDVSVKSLYEEFFRLLNVECNVDSTITNVLPYGYIDAENKTFITDLTNGALALCYGNRDGGVDVISRLHSRPLRATITDDDQIINIKSEQTIKTGYDGVSVTRNTKQESDTASLVSLKEQSLNNGNNTISSLKPSRTPIVRLKTCTVTSDVVAYAPEMFATPSKVDVVVNNISGDNTLVDIEITGTYLDTSKSVSEDTGSNLLSLDSNYVQTEQQATKATRYLKRIVDSNSPTLELDIRGNFRLKLGDKIRVQSTRYKIDYTGIIARINYTYEGFLTGSLTLVDSALFDDDEEVSS